MKDEIRHLRANAERDLQYHEVNLSLCRTSPVGCQEVPMACPPNCWYIEKKYKRNKTH